MTQSVDERVVKMTFDNKRFESNVKTTMGTLDKLNDKLKFKGAVQGAKELNAVTKKIDLSPLSRSVDEVQSRFSGLYIVGATALSNLTTAAMRAGQSMFRALTGPLVQGGITRALNLEAAEFQIKGLGKDWDALYKDMDYAVSGTAYGIDQAARAAAQFSASGIEAGDSMKAALRGISGVAAMTNSSYDEIARVFTGIAGQNRVMGNDLLQLSGRGMNAAATLGQYLNKTEVEVRDMVSKGKIDFATFAAAMDDAFGAHATKANETFTGALSNMKAALSRIGADVASPALDNLRNVFNSLRVVIDETRKSMKPFIDNLNNIQTSAANAFVSFVDLGGLKHIINGIGNIFTAFGKLIDPIKNALASIIPPITVEQIVGVTEAFENFTANLINADGIVTSIANSMTDGINKLIETFKPFVQSLQWGADGVRNYFRDSHIISDNIGNIAGKIIDFVLTLTQGIDATGALESAISGLGEGFSWLGKLFGAATSVASFAIAAVSNAVSNISEAVTNLTAEMGGGLQGLIELVFRIAEMLPQGIARIVSSVGQGLSDILDALPINEVLTIIKNFLSVSIMNNINTFTGELYNAKTTIGHIFDGVLDIVTGVKDVLDGVKDSIQAFTTSIKINALVKIALAITLLAISLKMLSEIPIAQLGASLGILVGGLVAMGGVIIGLSAAMAKVNKGAEGFLGLNDSITQLVKTAAAMLIFAHAIKVLTEAMTVLAGLKWGEIIKGLFAIAGMSAVLVAVTRLMDNTKGLIKASASLIIFGYGVKTMADAFKQFNEISWESLAKGMLTFAGAMVTVGKVMQMMNKTEYNLLGGKKSETSTKGIVKMSAAMVILGFALQQFASAISQFDNISIGGMVKGFAATAAFIGGIAALSHVKANFFGLIGQVMIMTMICMSLGKMLETVKEFEGISEDAVKKFIGTVIAFYGGIRLFCSWFKADDIKTFAAIAGGMWSISEGLRVMANAIKDFGWMETEQLVKGMTAVLLSMLVMTNALKSFTENKAVISAAFGFIAMAVALQAVGKAIKMFGEMDLAQLAKGTVAFALSLGVMTACLKLISNSSTSVLKGSGAMILMSIAITMLVGPIKTLGSMSLGDLAKGILGLASAMVVIGVAAMTLGNMAGAILKVAGTLAAMGVAIFAFGVGLTAIIYPIKSLSGMDPAQMATGIAGLGAVVMSLVSIVQVIDKMPKISLGTIGKLALLAAVIGMVAFMVAQLADINALAALEASLAISAVILSTGATLAIISLVPLVGAVKALATLGIVIAGISAIVVAMGAIAQIPGAKWIVSEGANFMRSIGEAIGGFFGGIAGGFASGVMLSVGAMLPFFGDSLSKFAIAASPFFSSMRTINSSSIDGIKALVEAVLLITAANFIDRITHAFGGGSSVENFARAIVPLGKAMNDFSKEVANIEPEPIMNAANAAKALAELANSIPPDGGILQVFSGHRDLSAFATDMRYFGKALADFSDLVENVKVDAIVKSAEAARALTDVANSIPESGGIFQLFSGEHDMDEFSRNLKPFAQALKDYSDIAEGIKPDVIIASASAGKAITELVNSLPQTGGIAQWFTGENDLGHFAYQLIPFGEAMKSYSDSVTDIKPDAIIASATAAKALSELINGLPPVDGVVQLWFGQQSLRTTFDGLSDFGKSMKEYSDAVTGINPGAILASTIAGKAITKLLESLPREGGVLGALANYYIGKQSISSIFKFMIPFAHAMVDYSRIISGKIDPGAVMASAAAGEAIAALMRAMPREGGILDDILGKTKSLSDFARELIPFGMALQAYSLSIGVIDEGTIGKIESSARAASAMVDVMKALPAEGGVVQFWTGNPGSLAAFGFELSLFGTSMASYAKSIADLDEASIAKIQSSAGAAKALVEVASALPKEEGVVQWWEGEAGDLGKFGAQLVTFGTSMGLFGIAVKDLDTDKVIASAEAAKKIVEFVKELPQEEGAFGWLDGTRMTLDQLGAQLQAFVPGFMAFASAVSASGEGATPIDADKLKAVGEAAKVLVELANSLNETANTRLATFGTTLKDLGTNFKDYSSSVSEIDETVINNTSAALQAIIDLCKQIPESINIDSLNQFKDALKTTGVDAVSEFTNGINDNKQSAIDAITSFVGDIKSTVESNEELMKTTFKTSATNSIGEYANGINDGVEDPVLVAIKEMLKSVTDEINRHNEDFERAGVNNVLGYAKGLRNHNARFEALRAAREMARQTLETVKRQDEQHSPSKAYARVAMYDVLGYAKGFSKYTHVSEDSAKNSAISTMDAFRRSINMAKIAAEQDMDFSPRITPVIDLSSTRTQAKKLNSLVGGMYSMPVDKVILNAAKAIQNGSEASSSDAFNKTGDSYSFVQNNYSPKALSRIDIYRDTKSQFAMARRSIKRQ